MVIYSINDLEKLSGVKAHTLRIWEKRYGIIEPKRTPTNIRYYLDEDLKLILNIAFLNKKGYKISKIAALEPSEIQRKVSEYSDVEEVGNDHLDALTLCILELNEAKFSRILDKSIKEYGFEYTMNNVIYPLLDKLSMMWMSGSIKGVHEHFVSNIVRRKTIHAVDSITDHYPSNPTFQIYLPENENHELSLLYLHYLLKARGMNVINLGINLSLIDVIDGSRIAHPDFIFVIINESLAGEGLEMYLEQLEIQSGRSKILLSGLQVVNPNVKLPKNVSVLSGTEDVVKFVDGLKTGSAPTDH